ncbi:MAG: hypothetical protein KGN32_13745 [Burkholderiales bacterium]|nr:hypothetical protein [Burkholderiales bacterium]
MQNEAFFLLSPLYIAHSTGVITVRAIDNILWFIFAGVWLAIRHVATTLSLLLTVIGIPFGVQHLKLAVLAPVEKTIVAK